MPGRKQGLAVGLAAALAVVAAPAFAQKSADTVRIGFKQPIRAIDRFYNPQPETTLMADMVFDTLIVFDGKERKAKPLVAESWKFLDPTTIEFKIRKGIKFQDGSVLDADDVAYTFNFAIDPKNNFRFKDVSYGWIKSVEKVDQYTVRMKTKQVYAAWFAKLAGNPYIVPSDVHGALADKSTWGRAPIGSGPYRAVKVDPSTGVTLVRNDAYHNSSKTKPAGRIGRIEIQSIPDQQTQFARMFAGQQDLVYGVSHDLIDSLEARPNIAVTVSPTIAYTYINLDAADKSGIKVFKDKRVREAVLHAIDRKALMAAFVPKSFQNAPLLDGMCNPWLIGCDITAKAPEFDLAKAKRLLADAGYPDGFSVEITTWGQASEMAEAVAGQLRRAGIKASVDAVTFGVYNKKRNSGKVNMFVSYWGPNVPDVDLTASFFFNPGPRNYTGDAMLPKLVKQGVGTLDLTKRKAIYRKLFDRVTDNAYMLPLVPVPAIVAHNKDLVLDEGGNMSPEGLVLNRIYWK